MFTFRAAVIALSVFRWNCLKVSNLRYWHHPPGGTGWRAVQGASMCPDCAHLELEFPGAKRVGRSEQAKPGGGSFQGERKVTFLIFLPKPHFRKITLCCVFSVPLSPLRCLSSLALLSSQGTCPGPAVAFRRRSRRAGTQVAASGAALLSSSPEQPDQHRSVPGRTRALPL